MQNENLIERCQTVCRAHGMVLGGITFKPYEDTKVKWVLINGNEGREMTFDFADYYEGCDDFIVLTVERIILQVLGVPSDECYKACKAALFEPEVVERVRPRYIARNKLRAFDDSMPKACAFGSEAELRDALVDECGWSREDADATAFMWSPKRRNIDTLKSMRMVVLPESYADTGRLGLLDVCDVKGREVLPRKVMA